MTIPTTSADAATALRGLAAVIRKHGTCAPAALDEIADRLTQHAEAGAVEDTELPYCFSGAGVVFVRTRDKQSLAKIREWLHTYEAASPTIQALREEVSRLRAIHPAQPASQEGEKWAKCVRSFAWRLPADEQDKAEELAKFLEAIPHPTGDKVRGLVEKWRVEAKRLREQAGRAVKRRKFGLDSATDETELRQAAQDAEAYAHELAAALDQEKNDGR